MSRQKALFLDRDGVIIAERDGAYNYTLQNATLLPGVAEFLSHVHSLGYKLIVITNQSGVAKGIYTKENVDEVHNHIQYQLSRYQQSLQIHDFFVCPHHPDFSACLCRKPQHLLIQRAIHRYRLDVNYCLMIGDRERDVLAAQKAGVTGILIESNSNLLPYLRLFA